MDTEILEIALTLEKMRKHAKKSTLYTETVTIAKRTLIGVSKKHSMDLIDALRLLLRKCSTDGHGDMMHWYAAAYLDIIEEEDI
jgi:hypothetical protein